MQAGLALGALFGWILSFPLMGPLLFRAAGEVAPNLGLLFLFSHGAGLLTLHRLPPAAAWSRLGVKGSGGLLALVTLAFPALAGVPGAPWVAVAAMGVLSAYLVLAWTPVLNQIRDALKALASAMALANLILGAANLPLPDLSRVGWELIAVLPLVAAYRIAAGPVEPVEQSSSRFAWTPAAKAAILPLAAFALADYFVGGIWYQAAVTGAPALGAWWPLIESLLSSGGILLFYLLVRHDKPATLLRYALSLLGLGLLLAAAGPTGVVGVAAYRSLLLLGLVAGDLFYWHRLWLLGKGFGVRRIMGLGLGASLWLIGTANLVTGIGATALLPAPLFLLIGAAILFLAIPLVFPERVSEPPSAVPGRNDASVPGGLTATEMAVYQLLVSGATDQEIAERLVVSKHTVKFHVRNILHKVGAANRRELLSRLVARQEHPQ